MVIAIACQKGGTGKTTTTLAMAASLARRGKNVLIVDMDAQANATATAGGEGSPDVFDILTGKAKATAAIHPTTSAVTNENLFGASIIPAGQRLIDAEAAIIGVGRESRLRKALQPVKGDFDFILVDCPPALGILTANALTAADAVIVPATAEPYSIQSIAQLKLTVEAVKEYFNPSLVILGILLTRYRATRLMAGMGEQAKRAAKELETTLYNTRIRESTAAKEAQAKQRPLHDYKGGAGVASDYEAFTDELLKQLKRIAK